MQRRFFEEPGSFPAKLLMEDIRSMKERAPGGCLGYRGYYTTQLCGDPYFLVANSDI